MNQLKSGRLSESAIHKTVMDWIRLYPHIRPYVIHTPNEGKRSYQFGSLLKQLGMRAGVADLFIAIPAHGYHGAWLELKSAKGKPTESQLEFLSDMYDQGYYTAICYGIDEALQILKWYCF